MESTYCGTFWAIYVGLEANVFQRVYIPVVQYPSLYPCPRPLYDPSKQFVPRMQRENPVNIWSMTIVCVNEFLTAPGAQVRQIQAFCWNMAVWQSVFTVEQVVWGV